MDTEFEFRGKLRDKGTHPTLAAAAVVVIAVVGIGLLPADGGETATGSGAVPSTASTAAQSTSLLAIVMEPGPESVGTKLEPGPYALRWGEMWLHLRVPEGWASTDAGASIYKEAAGSGRHNAPTLTVHAVSSVVADICAADAAFVAVGPTVEDVTTALVNQVGLEKLGPTDVTLGGHPAKTLVVTLPGSCPGPEGRWIWASATEATFGVLRGGRGTIHVVDVNGDRLVITTHYRGASAEDIAELDAVVASIDIEPGPPSAPADDFPQGDPWLAIGRHSLTVQDVRLSFHMPTPDWESHSFYISKSIRGPQGAEAMILWTSYPDGPHADPCPSLLSSTIGPSAADLAAAVSTVSGTDIISGPLDVAVGGRSAKQVILTVRETVGCEPGYFYTWDESWGGAFWASTEPRDTIRVWIVDVDGTRIFIGGATHEDAGSEVEQEIEQIIASIRFE